MIVAPTKAMLRDVCMSTAFTTAVDNADWKNILEDTAVTWVDGENSSWSYVYIQSPHSSIYVYQRSISSGVLVSCTNPCADKGPGHVKFATTMYQLVFDAG